MIFYSYQGMYQYVVFDDEERIGSLLSTEGVHWWFKPKNGISTEKFISLEAAKDYIENEYE